MEKDILTLADYIVATIQQLYLNDVRNKDMAFAVRLRIDFDDHGSDEPAQPVTSYLQIAVSSHYAYKRVYVAMMDRSSDFQSAPWQHVCNHDSAWREEVRDCTKRWYRAVVLESKSRFNVPISELSRHIVVDKMKIADLVEIFAEGKVPDLPLSQFSTSA